MRLIKLIVLAAMTAAIVTAFVGVTSASAITSLEEVVLCKEDKMLVGAGCPVTQQVGSGTLLDAELQSSTKSELLTTLGTVKCTSAKFTARTTFTLAHGEITEASAENCVLGTTNCTVTLENLSYLFLILLITGHEEYHVIVSEGNHESFSPPRLFVDCGTSALKCKFVSPSSETLLSIELKAEDTVWSVNQVLGREGGSGFLCPNGATWQAKYLVRCLLVLNYYPCWPAMHENTIL